MNKFIGEILVLLGSMGIVAISLISGGCMLYGLFQGHFGVLTESSFLSGWISFLLTLFSKIYALVYSLNALRLISKGRSNKKSLYLSFIFVIFEVCRDIYIFRNISDFYAKDMFVGLMIAVWILYLIQLIGFILNYKKR